MHSLLAGDRADVHPPIGEPGRFLTQSAGRAQGGAATHKGRSWMSTTPAVDAAALQTLADGFAGRVLQSSDDDYEGARRVHNGLIDRRPAVIAECIESADVAAAVRFATANGLEIAVRGGGHNVAGRSVCEGGLMIDL